MTTIGVDTSPLQAAREWRGIGMVAAALNAGLTAAQVEALETGGSDAFGSTDEMIAAAVVYGASLGIGRDEAVALLDRTMMSTGVDVEIEDRPVRANPVAPNRFSEAVRERSARIADRDGSASSFVGSSDLPLEPMIAPTYSEDFDGPTPEQAVEASQEIHLGEHLAVGGMPWEREDYVDDADEASFDLRDAPQGELETWVADRDPSSFGSVPSASIATTRFGSGVQRGLERLVGTDRADATMEWAATTGERVTALARSTRERLRSSEHATLIVAIGGGAVLIALMVAIGGALGGGDENALPTNTTASTPAKSAAAATNSGSTAKAEATPPAKAVVKPVLVPARLKVDVINTGRRTGAAAAMASNLKAAKYRIGEVGNAKGGYSTSTVLYRAGLEREARILARRLGISAVRQAPGTSTQLMVAIV